MITLNEVSKTAGTKTLFEKIIATFNDGHRYGLTGPNGAGKSTLLKIILGLIPATSGSVTLPARVGFLRQNIEDFADYLVIDAVMMGNERLWKAMQERESLYDVEMTDAIGIRFGELEEIIAEEDGYSAEANGEKLLLGMGIDANYHQMKMRQIPTDMQFRALLCQALFGDPQALLLDEPTNHLDLQSISWLEEFLKNYKGALVVVSHDRHFLNAVCTDIADIDYETLIIYPGNYDSMIVAKSSVRERAELDAKSKEKKISQLREFVAKFGAGTRASQVQSRLREIDRLQPQDLKKSNIQRPYIRFLTDKSSGKVVYKLKDVGHNYDDLEVFKKLSCEIHKGDKIGVIGNNGRGKTTFLKLLVGALTPSHGHIEIGHQVQTNYFPQNHNELVDKKSSQTAFEWLRNQKAGIYDQDIRSALGKLLFGGDDAFKPLSALSGGETARLIIAGMMLSAHNTLILDEPNNHLDLEAVSALSVALSEYPGTVIVASHDRELIGHVAQKIIAFEEKGIRIFDGNLESYIGSH